MSILRYFSIGLVCLSIAAPLSAPAIAAGEQPVKVAIFDFELIDTSLEGEKRGVDPAETARLKKISDLLRGLLEKSGKYTVIPTAPVADQINDAGYIYSCNGCDIRMAKELDADLSFTGHVHKVSRLILSINIFVNDVATGKRLKNMSADIRGDTDESWTHGVRWLVRNRILKD